MHHVIDTLILIGLGTTPFIAAFLVYHILKYTMFAIGIPMCYVFREKKPHYFKDRVCWGVVTTIIGAILWGIGHHVERYL